MVNGGGDFFMLVLLWTKETKKMKLTHTTMRQFKLGKCHCDCNSCGK